MKKLQKEWNERLKLRAEGDNLYTKGNNLRADGDNFYAEGNKLHSEGKKLYIEGDLVFINAILRENGNIKMEWKNWNEKNGSYECHLENGEIYDFKK